MKKKGIIFIVLILIFSCIGMVGYKMSTPKPPKDVDAEVYKKSIEILAYTERCEKNDTNSDAETYQDYVDNIKEICKNQNRDMTDIERKISQDITLAGLKLYYYKTENLQDALDYYDKHLKDAKLDLGLSPNQDSNKVWNRIKDK